VGVQYLAFVSEHILKETSCEAYFSKADNDPARLRTDEASFDLMKETIEQTIESMETGVSIDGSPVERPPPVNSFAIIEMLNYFAVNAGAIDGEPAVNVKARAWRDFMDCVRAAHFAKKLKGEISGRERTPMAGFTKKRGCGCSSMLALALVAFSLLVAVIVWTAT